MSTSPPLAVGSGRMSRSAAGMLAVLCGAIFLEGVDAAMLNIALPSIRAELGLSTTTLSAVVSAYVLAYAGLMLLGGRVADMYGKRKVFLTALTVFLLFLRPRRLCDRGLDAADGSLRDGCSGRLHDARRACAHQWQLSRGIAA